MLYLGITMRICLGYQAAPSCEVYGLCGVIVAQKTEAGPDRIIQLCCLMTTCDSAGYKSADSEGPTGVYKGYVVRIAVGCSTVRFYGDPTKVQLEEFTSYVTALMVDPARKTPGPAGVKLVERSYQIALNVTDASADSAFPMKSNSCRNYISKASTCRL